MEAKNKTKQREKTDINKNRNKRSQPQSAVQLSEYLIFKDMLGFHYQEHLFSASCYMLRNKDNYSVGNIIFLTLNILCLPNSGLFAFSFSLLLWH